MMVNEEYRGLVYPWGRKSPMGYGEPLEVAPGVWWVRFEMPGGLDHINIWLEHYRLCRGCHRKELC